MSTPVDDFEIIHALSQAFNVKYTTVSAVFLLFYDTAIGFSDEIKLIWLQRWSFGKVLYIIARYGCFIDVAIALLYNFSPALSPKVIQKYLRKRNVLIKCMGFVSRLAVLCINLEVGY